MNFNNISRYIKFIVIALIVIYITIKIYKPVLRVSIPFILSLIFAYLLSPIVNFFIKKKMSRFLSVVITYVLILVLLIISLSFLFPIIYSNFNEILIKVPEISEKYRVIINEIIIRYQLSDLPISVKQGINQSIQNLLNLFKSFVINILNLIESLISNIIYIVLIPIITFYILKDSDYLKQKLILLIPCKYRDDVIITWYQIDLILKRYLRGELIVALIVGLMTFVGLYLVGVKFSIVLGFVAGITNLIPYLGPFLGIIPSVLVAFIESPMLALKATLVFIFIQQLESAIISPKIVGDCVGFHPITVIFLILLFEQIFGLIGMFFALPLTLIIMVIFNRIIDSIVNKKENI